MGQLFYGGPFKTNFMTNKDVTPMLPPDLPVLLLLLRLSLLFEAFLRRLLAFLYPFAFLFHNTLLSSVFLTKGREDVKLFGTQKSFHHGF